MPLPRRHLWISLCLIASSSPALVAQPPDRGPGGGRGPGRRETVKLLERFDENQSGRLEREERDSARTWLKEEGNQRRSRGGRFGRRGGRGGRGVPTDPPTPGPRVQPDEVEDHPDRKLYATSILRTMFFEFKHDDWEEELAAFHNSDVEVDADLTVDGQRLEQVGVRFRGNTSFMMVPEGRKRSLNVSIDFADGEQRLYDYKTLNLLNCHGDPSFLREVLHAQIGRQFMPVPRANLVHVVINGESWGVFANVQQVNKDYLREAFGSRQGARWRVPPDFAGNGGMKYLGEDTASYVPFYEAKSGVDDAALERLVTLCHTLNQTTVAERREALPALLDIDDALWFLAIDNVLLDGDGYLTRASDHALYLDPIGVFHPITYDNNEILGGSPRAGGGPGRRGPGGFGEPPPGAPPRGESDPGQRREGSRGRRRGGFGRGGHRVEPGQSPLAGHDDENRPLLHRLLEVPEWRARYLAFVHSLATQALRWDRLGLEVERLHSMIAPIVHTDTRKLYDEGAFDSSIEGLRAVIDERLEALLEHEALRGPWPAVEGVVEEQVATAAGSALRVTARAGKDVDIHDAVLHWQDKRPGTFVSVLMKRIGAGEFRAEIAAQGKIRYYVEMRSAGKEPRVAFYPAGASSKAARFQFER